MYSSRIVLNQQQIEAINWRNLQRTETGLFDLSDAEMMIVPEQLQMLFQLENLAQEPRYSNNGTLYDERFYNALEEKIQASLPNDSVSARCAVAVTNALIRAYPTMAGSYRADGIGELDRFAVSILKLGEPALIYCETADNIWCYVQTTQISGWVLRDALALEPDLYRWQQYCDDREQVIMADSKRTICYIAHDGLQHQQMLLMGTKLSLYDATRDAFLISLPIKDKKGNLAVLQIRIPRDGSFIPNVMPVSAQNIVSQAKKMLGEPYGWGGSNFDRDCTSLITDVYAVFGLQFPRNSKEQLQMLGVEQCPEDREQKYQFISNLMPGSILYAPGHAMLYLGEQQQLCILHNSYAMSLPDKDRLILHKIRRVVEGDLSQHRATGETYFDAVTAVWSPERQKQFLNCRF